MFLNRESSKFEIVYYNLRGKFLKDYRRLPHPLYKNYKYIYKSPKIILLYIDLRLLNKLLSS